MASNVPFRTPGEWLLDRYRTGGLLPFPNISGGLETPAQGTRLGIE
jgi:hypothetical protein